MLEDYLRHYVTASQKNWVKLLDSAQFAYNLHRSSATGFSPFKLVLGSQPLTPQELSMQKYGGKCPAAYRFARDKHELLEEAHDSLAKAQKRMKKYADRKQRPLEFSVGDQVLLKLTPQMWKNVSAKTSHRGLISKYEGPFEVVQRVGTAADKLKLPDQMKMHPTFHVSFLKPFHGDSDPERKQRKRAPPLMGKSYEKEIHKILDHKKTGTSKTNFWNDYLVWWKGEEEENATWEKGENLWQFEKEIGEYWAHPPMRTSDFSGGGGLSRTST